MASNQTLGAKQQKLYFRLSLCISQYQLEQMYLQNIIKSSGKLDIFKISKHPHCVTATTEKGQSLGSLQVCLLNQKNLFASINSSEGFPAAKIKLRRLVSPHVNRTSEIERGPTVKQHKSNKKHFKHKFKKKKCVYSILFACKII